MARGNGGGASNRDGGVSSYIDTRSVSFAPMSTSGAVRRFARPQGAERQALQFAALQQAEAGKQRKPLLLQEIHETAAQGDPLLLYSRLAVFNEMLRALPGTAIFGSDAMLEFYGGLVTAMPVDHVIDRLEADDDPWILHKVHELLRELAAIENHSQNVETMRTGPRDSLSKARNLLQLEQSFDRMLGYPDQLRPIFTEIVRPLAAKSRTQLGFALGDALVIADAYFDVRLDRLREVDETFHLIADRFPQPHDHESQSMHAAWVAAARATFDAAPVETDLVGLVADRTSVPRAEVELLVQSLSTPLGSQPEFSDLNGTNTLRRHPIISVPGRGHLWAVPGDFIHCALDWAAEVCQQQPKLLEAFDKRRQDACEALTHKVLADVFCDEQVHRSVNYPWDGQRPDIDVLVAMPGATIIFEAKGGRLTDPGRRGAPDRVRKKATELVDKALDQNARTIKYLDSGAQDFKQGRQRWSGTVNAKHVVSVIVTLERVDPFATVLPDGGKRTDAPGQGTWLVNLADLLMIAEVLRHPAEFFAYAELRARINNAGGPLIFVETDAVGAWCEYRISPKTPVPGRVDMLSTTSDVMNDYFAYSAGHRPPRPTAGVPLEVLSALDIIHQSEPDSWHDLVVAALAARPAQWQSVVKAVEHILDGHGSQRARKRLRRASSGLPVTECLQVRVRPAGDPLPSEVSLTLQLQDQDVQPIAERRGTANRG